MTDAAELLARIALDRDKTAFADLFDDFAPRLTAFLMRKGCSAGTAEDVIQDTMLAVWRRAESFDPGRARPNTWIFTIARNRYIDRLRRKATATPPKDLDPAMAPTTPPLASEDLELKERAEKVRAALEFLPEEQKEVILLSFVEDLPHSAIAETLGLPLGTVKSRTRLAFGRLRKELEGFR